jgi:hypothetical protein
LKEKKKRNLRFFVVELPNQSVVLVQRRPPDTRKTLKRRQRKGGAGGGTGRSRSLWRREPQGSSVGVPRRINREESGQDRFSGRGPSGGTRGRGRWSRGLS